GPSRVSGNKYSCGTPFGSVEYDESFRDYMRPMNPFDTTGTIENEPTFEKVRMPIPDEAAILIDLARYVLGEG
ncbi:MAG: hypothetical protein WCB50_06525, partial [Pseudolabrys sp.]